MRSNAKVLRYSSMLWVQDTLVANAAAAGALTQNLVTTWSVIGSDNNFAARDHTGTNPTTCTTCGVTIFNLFNTAIATSYADLWDGSLLAPINRAETGATIADHVWTGTTFEGLPAHRATLEFGSPKSGLSSLTGNGWISHTTFPNASTLHLYAISDIFTVQTPEPATNTLFSLALLGLVLARRRRKLG